jgi:hypothetical protein
MSAGEKLKDRGQSIISAPVPQYRLAQTPVVHPPGFSLDRTRTRPRTRKADGTYVSSHSICPGLGQHAAACCHCRGRLRRTVSGSRRSPSGRLRSSSSTARITTCSNHCFIKLRRLASFAGLSVASSRSRCAPCYPFAYPRRPLLRPGYAKDLSWAAKSERRS